MKSNADHFRSRDPGEVISDNFGCSLNYFSGSLNFMLFTDKIHKGYYSSGDNAPGDYPLWN